MNNVILTMDALKEHIIAKKTFWVVWKDEDGLAEFMRCRPTGPFAYDDKPVFSKESPVLKNMEITTLEGDSRDKGRVCNKISLSGMYIVNSDKLNSHAFDNHFMAYAYYLKLSKEPKNEK